MHASNDSSHITALLQTLRVNRHRLLVVLSGERAWQNQSLNQLLMNLLAPTTESPQTAQWLGLGLDEERHRRLTLPQHITLHRINGQQLPHYLGQEIDGALLDVAQGFSANSLGMLAGMVKAGGLLVLLTPPVNIWRTAVNAENARFLNTPYTLDQAWSYFTDYLIHQWQSPSEYPVLWLHQHNQSQSQNHNNDQAWLSTFQQLKNLTPTRPHNLPTADQHLALAAIHSVAFGHRKRPLVISADRGRGKSSVLGIAAIDSLLAGKQRIVLTAPRLEQLHSAFDQAWLQCQRFIQHVEQHSKNSSHNAEQALINLSQSPGLVTFNYQGQLKTLEFIAPDQLLLSLADVPMIDMPMIDILMVDEAAQLPTPMLNGLLARYHRLVFATTLHGYEGSGRGFELRFKQTLQRVTPQWKNLHLNQPIRWNPHDPLEQAIERALCLNAQTAVFAPHQPLPDAINFKDVDAGTPNINTVNTNTVNISPFHISQLFNAQHHIDPHALSDFNALFSLLVQAHYQTSPNDLQHLLNAPNLRIEVARFNQKIVGVLVSVAEGGLTINAENREKRENPVRVHGHLVPQLLVNHYATDALLAQRTWRVMRLAVHPQCQRLGIGHALLNHWQAQAQKHHIDYLSASFGAMDDLLRFWLQQGYTPYHLGVKRDKASGTHNAVLIKPMHLGAQNALRPSQQAFAQQFAHNLIESLPWLESDIVWSILRALPKQTTQDNETLTRQDELKQVMHYASGQRRFESLSGQLWHFSLNHPAQFAMVSTQHQAIWCDKVLKKQAWSTVAKTHQLAGRAAIETQLKQVLHHLYNAQIV